MVVCNYFTNDNRVFRAANMVQEEIGTVTLLAYFRKDLPELEIQGAGFTVQRLNTYLPGWLPKQITNFFKYRLFMFNARRKAANIKPDIVHCHDYNTLFLGIYCKKKFGSKLIYDNHEYFQDLRYLHRYPLFVRKRIARFERNALNKWVDKLIVVSPGIALEYSKLYDKPIAVVRNIPEYPAVIKPPIDALYVSLRENLQNLTEKGNILLLHMGVNLTRGRGFNYTLALLNKLPEKYKLVIFGAKNQEEINRLYANDLIESLKHRVFIYQAIHTSKIFLLKNYFSYGLSIIEPIYFSYKYSLPNKLFEYIAMELPVIVSDIPEQILIVDRYKNGIIAPLGDVSSAALSLQNTLIDKLSIKSAKTELNWMNERKVLLQVYN